MKTSIVRLLPTTQTNINCRTAEWLLMARGAAAVKDHPIFLHAFGEPRATNNLWSLG